METILYLIRHGATANNLSRPYVLQGCRTDPPLSPTGVAQAQAVAKCLAAVRLDGVYSSPLQRAYQTAEIIASAHGLDVERIEALTEVDVGRWEGLTWEQVRQAEPEAYRAFVEDPGTTPYGGGESFQAVYDRCAPALEELLRRHAGGALAVAGHNVVNRVYLAGVMGLPLRKARELGQVNGGINIVRRVDAKTQVLTLNSLFHLGDLLHLD